MKTMNKLKKDLIHLTHVYNDEKLIYEKAMKLLTESDIKYLFVYLKPHCEFHRVTSLKNIDYTEISDIMPPPTKCVKKWGRINMPNESLLYCSECFENSYFENRWFYNETEIGDKISVYHTIWKTQKKLCVLYLANPNKHIEIINSLCIKDIFNKYPDIESYIPSYNLIHDIFSISQSQNRYIYSISNAIIKHAKNIYHFDGVLYLNIGVGNGYNLAFYDESIKNQDVIPQPTVSKKECAKVDENKIEFEANNFHKKGKIVWSKKYKRLKIDW